MAATSELRTGKEAYIWLLERFLSRNPEFFRQCRSSWLMRYFAEDKDDLFIMLPEAQDPNAYHRLTNGWYANVGVSTGQKFELLLGLGCMLGYRYPDDWDWQDLRGSADISKRRERAAKRPPAANDYIDEDELGFEGLASIRREKRRLK